VQNSVGKAGGMPCGWPHSHENTACHTDHGHGLSAFGM
jgi:hypothetical protein